MDIIFKDIDGNMVTETSYFEALLNVDIKMAAGLMEARTEGVDEHLRMEIDVNVEDERYYRRGDGSVLM